MVQKVFLISFTMYLIVLLPYINSLKIISWVIVTVTDQLGKHHLVAGDVINSTTLDKFGEVQAVAEEFIRGTWSWGFLDFTMRLVTKYLSLQYHSTAVYCCTGLLIVLHVLFTWLYTVYDKMGLAGLVLGGTLSRVVSLVVLLTYCCCRRKVLAWSGFTTKILYNWREMIVLGLSASVNVFSEMGMYELAIFLSQFRGVDYLSTVVISFQIITLIYSTTYGVCYAAAAMIGTALGEGDCSKVKQYIKLSLVNAVGESVFLAVLAYCFRTQLVSLFTDDPRVITETSNMLWILLIEVPLDHIQSVFTYGILVTVGSQVFVATSLSVICYGICSPAIAAFIFFTSLDGIGVLYGMLLFVSLSCVVCGVKIMTLDLDREVKEAQTRVQSSTVEGASLIVEESDESLLEASCLDSSSDSLCKIYREDQNWKQDFRKNYIKVPLIFTLIFAWSSFGIFSLFK